MLHSIDYGILVLYLVITLAIGFWSARRARASSKGFFVAERTLPWFVVGFTMVAASISAEQMLGEVGFGFDAGLVVSNWDLGVYPALVLMLFIFLPLYLRSGVTTIPEYLEKRYDRRTRLLFAIYTVFNNAFVTLVMVLALGATALKAFLGLDPVWAVVLLAAFTGIYTVYGGMSSVAWTETFQCVLLLAGGLTIFGVGLAHVEGGWSGLMERMPDPHLIRPVTDEHVPWPGLILLMFSTNVWYCCTNQFYVQGTLGAKSEWHGRMGVLLTAFLGPVMALCFAFPGYIARDLVEQGQLAPIANPDDTYPILVHALLGPGLRGFLVAAVIGAIMSSVAAIVNATASVSTNDIYKRWLKPAATEADLVRMGRYVGLGTLAIACPLVLMVMERRYIFTYSQNLWAILAIPIMLVFTYGALWKRTSARAANATMIFIIPFIAVPFVLGNSENQWLALPGGFRIHLFNFAFLLWLAAAAFMFAASLLSAPPDEDAVRPYVWRRSTARLPAVEGYRGRWYGSISLWTVIAGLMYFAIYIRYW